MSALPTWWSEKPPHEREVVDHLSPVRLVFDDPLPADEEIKAFLLPEQAVWRVLRQLTRSPGRHITSLRVDSAVVRRDRPGCASEVWHPGQVHLGGPASQYVARVEGLPDSGPLWVTNEASITRRRRASGTIDLASSGIAPIALEVLGEKVVEFQVFAPVDPTVELSVLTPSREDPRLSEHVNGYLGQLERIYELGDDGPLRRAFNEEYRDYLANEAGLNGVAEPSSLELEEGGRAEMAARLSFDRAGRSLLTVVALASETGTPLVSSELIGITVDDDGGLSVDF